MTRRFLWPSFALPGAAWLVLLFLVPTYAVLAVAFGTVDPIFSNPVPVWNPLHWQFDTMRDVLRQLRPGQPFWTVFVRTFAYVGISLAGCLAIGYPVAYYVARHARRTKTLLLVLLIVPFWVSYLMRMLAWVEPAPARRLVNRVARRARHPLAAARVARRAARSSVILGLIYGYVPFFILPLYAALDRIDGTLLEAARDLGASPLAYVPARHAAAVRARDPRRHACSSRCRCSATTTPTTSSPGSPRTTMIGNQIEPLLPGRTADGPVGASLVLVLLGAAAGADVVLPVGHRARVARSPR